jgi:hypothetical protein
MSIFGSRMAALDFSKDEPNVFRTAGIPEIQGDLWHCFGEYLSNLDEPRRIQQWPEPDVEHSTLGTTRCGAAIGRALQIVKGLPRFLQKDSTPGHQPNAAAGPNK